MPLLNEVVGVPIVRCEEKSSGIPRRHQGNELLQVLGHGPFPHQNHHPIAELFPRLLSARAFVVRSNPGGNISSQILPPEARPMAVNGLTPSHLNFSQQIGHTPNHAREIHHLSQTQHPLLFPQSF